MVSMCSMHCTHTSTRTRADHGNQVSITKLFNWKSEQQKRLWSWFEWDKSLVIVPSFIWFWLFVSGELLSASVWSAAKRATEHLKKNRISVFVRWAIVPIETIFVCSKCFGTRKKNTKCLISLCWSKEILDNTERKKKSRPDQRNRYESRRCNVKNSNAEITQPEDRMC